VIRRLPAAALALALLAAAPIAAAQDGAPPAEDPLLAALRRQDGLVEAGDGDRALAEARDRVAKEPKSAEARYLLGRLLGNLGRIDEAKVQFDGAVEIDGHYAPAWRGLAIVHVSRKEMETAIREARKAWELDGSNESCLLLVNCLLASGDRTGTHKLLQEAIAKDPSNDRLRAVYGGQLLQEGFYREAERELRQVLVNRPQDVSVRSAVVGILYRTGRKDEAVAECRDAVKRAPKDDDSRKLVAVFVETLVAARDFARGADLLAGILAFDLPAEFREKSQQLLRDFRAAAADPDASAAPAPGPPDAKEVLRKLDEGTVEERRAAIKVLWDNEITGIPPEVMRRVGDEDETVRLYAVRLLGRYGNERMIWLLDTLLYRLQAKESSVAVRTQALSALRGISARTGSPAGLPVAVRAIQEETEGECLRAGLRAVREITGKSFVEDVDALVPGKDVADLKGRVAKWWFDDETARHWRIKSAEAIGTSKDRNLVWYVIPWVKEEDPAIRAAMLDCMAKITGDAAWRTEAAGTAEERVAAAEKAYKALGDLDRRDLERSLKSEPPKPGSPTPDPGERK
jgi:Flp pilus assembly protein TadD